MKLTETSKWFVLDKPIGEPEIAKNYKEDRYCIQRIEKNDEIVWYGWNVNWQKVGNKNWQVLNERMDFVDCEMPIYEKLYLESLENKK